MKQYVCDLEYAKELKELGLPQVATYCWRKTGCRYVLYPIALRIKDSYDAFSSDEILKELPTEINGHVLEILRYENGTFEVDYKRAEFFGNPEEYLIKDKTLYYKLSNALAQLYSSLKKEGYIK